MLFTRSGLVMAAAKAARALFHLFFAGRDPVSPAAGLSFTPPLPRSRPVPRRIEHDCGNCMVAVFTAPQLSCRRSRTTVAMSDGSPSHSWRYGNQLASRISIPFGQNAGYRESLSGVGASNVERINQHVDTATHAADIQIDDLAKIVQICNQLPQLFASNQVFWRGHGNSEWPLLPQVFRPNPHAPDLPKYNERVLISAFQARAPSRSHVKVPESEDYCGWLFFAQHYGLPTRLLDWTESPLVALYFAVENAEEKDDGCIWALRPGGLNAYFSFRDNRAYRRAVEKGIDPQTMEIENGGIQDPYQIR